MGALIKEMICPHCGKKFAYRQHHKYKLKKNGKIVHYCGYNCWVANDTRRYSFERGRYSK